MATRRKVPKLQQTVQATPDDRPEPGALGMELAATTWMLSRLTLEFMIWNAAVEPAGGFTTGAELTKLGSAMMTS